MGNMEDRWRRRQSESRARPPETTAQPGGPDHVLSEEAWRQLQATHLQRQSSAIESIRTYVAVWFWLTIVGAVLIAFAAR